MQSPVLVFGLDHYGSRPFSVRCYLIPALPETALSRSLSPSPPRLFDWVFSSVHSDDLSDEIKTVYLNGLYEVRALRDPGFSN